MGRTFPTASTLQGGDDAKLAHPGNDNIATNAAKRARPPCTFSLFHFFTSSL
ncbi:MAG: hypothetical protein J0M33_28995 [Anaerolineae bacterium]|nr:hypothetical protein [Anaerolineae bacterium]